MGINIKLCTLEQIDVLQEICIETFQDTFGHSTTNENMMSYLNAAYTVEKLQAILTSPQSGVYFIYDNEQLAGYMQVNCGKQQTEPMGEDALEIEAIYIKRTFKRRGLGKALIHQAFEHAKALGKRKVWLGVWEHNFSAITFYQLLGFYFNGSHSFWVGHDEQTDLIMEKVI